ncbi:MAG TPA: sigma-70 family RNA polymerase sigma factor [Bradyrhizobium sp.]|uniref:RNA polymerase sigma factor n=1 Tax=Bradyrhizobium sp. TaxID=376 RepID=UPI002CB6D062|nr:sigma-70 family RNA polymerase sigma factor [Bradyrhizobium sp.]HLZ05470.1 sigma-70 family RNA polymerase sigma factor [Bradyrhizobium sp.]
MNGPALERVFRSASGRIIAVLAARFRDLALAEDAFSESCLRAARVWPARGVPDDPAAWLYRVAQRIVLDSMRRDRKHDGSATEEISSDPGPEEIMMDDARVVPDERLRLIFICCHPSVAIEARAALTLRLVCGLSVTEIARAFLIQEATLAQRLLRAKRKIADAGVPFELPAPDSWPERLDAVLSTLEIAYAKAHEDAAGSGPHAGFASEVLHLTKLLAHLVPNDGAVAALAAQVRYAEARRPARVSAEGWIIPLSEQDPKLWRRDLIEEANRLLADAIRMSPSDHRTLQGQLQQVWCSRQSLQDAAPWPEVLRLYDRLLLTRDDPIVRINRAVALAEIEGADAALVELSHLDTSALEQFLPYHAVRADLLARSGRRAEAADAYARALALDPPAAERQWLERKAAGL